MNNAELKLYIDTTEYGTELNPISFVGAIAGQITNHPLNPFFLWNDKGGLLDSASAKNIEIQVLDMWIQDELLGVGDGTPSQTYTCGIIPVIDTSDVEEIQVKVGSVVWERITDFTGQSSSAEVYTINPATGVVTFGNSVWGKAPAIGQNITITYMPDLTTYGTDISAGQWFEVRSFETTTNPVIITDEQNIAQNTTQVEVSNPKVLSVSGVWLLTDPSHLGTNYYTGGSFVASSGLITLGTVLPSAGTAVLIDYTHTMLDDAEADFTPIGDTVSHIFASPICQNNAKLLYFRLNLPADANPSGGSNLSFRVRLRYRQ